MSELAGPASARPARRGHRRQRRLVPALAVLLASGVVAGSMCAAATMPAPGSGTTPPSLHTLAVDSALPAQPPAVPAPPAPCASVALITVDDAAPTPGTPGLLGEIAGGLAPLGSRLQVVDVAEPPVLPPAAAAPAWAGAVRTALESTAQRCPGTTLLVYAYSEGAVAAANALATLEGVASPALQRLEGVALVGNPARDPARRTIPAAVPGRGLSPTGPGSPGRLAERTVEVCAPTDPVCASPAPDGDAGILGLALASPEHDAYRQLPSGVGGRTAAAWLTDAARQVVDLVSSPSTPAPPTTAAGDPGLPPGDVPGLIWRAARTGEIGFGAFDRNDYDEQSGSPTVVASPNVPGRRALRFSVAGGEPRSEMQPRTPDPREGQTQFIGYYGVLGRDFPTTADAFQIIMQWHHPGATGSPPLTVEVSNGEVRLTGGENKRFVTPVAAAEPGDTLDLVLRVTFSSDPRKGAVSVWKDGRELVHDFHPPQGTLYRGDSSAYMKMGLYRSTSIDRPGTVFVNDVLVGSTFDSVSPTRR